MPGKATSQQAFLLPALILIATGFIVCWPGVGLLAPRAMSRPDFFYGAATASYQIEGGLLIAIVLEKGTEQTLPQSSTVRNLPGIHCRLSLQFLQVHGRRTEKARASGTHSLTLQAKFTMETQAMSPQTSITTSRRSDRN